MLRSNALQKLQASIAAHDFLTPEEMAAIHCPFLLIWAGPRACSRPRPSSSSGRNLPPRGRLEVVPGWGHAPQMEHPDELREKLTVFVKAMAQGSSYTNCLPA